MALHTFPFFVALCNGYLFTIPPTPSAIHLHKLVSLFTVSSLLLLQSVINNIITYFMVHLYNLKPI